MGGDVERYEFHKIKLRHEYIASRIVDVEKSSRRISRSSNSSSSVVENSYMKFIVTDNLPSNRKVLKLLISNMGHGVIDCVDGEMAIEAVKESMQPGKSYIDGVFLELKLPGLVSKDDECVDAPAFMAMINYNTFFPSLFMLFWRRAHMNKYIVSLFTIGPCRTVQTPPVLCGSWATRAPSWE